MSHTEYSLITWSTLPRQTGQSQFLALISFKQGMHPAICPHGIKAPSTGPSQQITHEEDEEVVVVGDDGIESEVAVVWMVEIS